MTPEQITNSIQALQQLAARLEENIKVIFKRLDDQTELSQSVHQLASSVEITANELKHMRRDHEQMRADVNDMKAKPGRRWEDIVRTAVTVIASGIVGYFISNLT